MSSACVWRVPPLCWSAWLACAGYIKGDWIGNIDIDEIREAIGNETVASPDHNYFAAVFALVAANCIRMSPDKEICKKQAKMCFCCDNRVSQRLVVFVWYTFDFFRRPPFQAEVRVYKKLSRRSFQKIHAEVVSAVLRRIVARCDVSDGTFPRFCRQRLLSLCASALTMPTILRVPPAWCFRYHIVLEAYQ